MSEPGVQTLVLAAGQGRRFRQQLDQDKLSVPSHVDDEASPSVLQATLMAVHGATEECLVVVRKDNAPLRDWLAINESRFGYATLAVATNGLGHSLAQAVAHRPAARGWLVVLGDMPYVRSETLRRLAAAIREDALVVPVYEGRRGHPRGIGSAHRQALLALDGDQGAQALFADACVEEIEVDDPGILQDIDRPQDRLPLR